MLCACEVCVKRGGTFLRDESGRGEKRGAMRSGASGCVVKRRRIAEM